MKIILVFFTALTVLLGIRSRGTTPSATGDGLTVTVVNEYPEAVRVRVYIEAREAKAFRVEWLSQSTGTIPLERPVELTVRAWVHFSNRHLDELVLPGVEPGEHLRILVGRTGGIGWTSR